MSTEQGLECASTVPRLCGIGNVSGTSSQLQPPIFAPAIAADPAVAQHRKQSLSSYQC